MNLEGMEKLMEVVPQTWGEAKDLYPWLESVCESHEWDNRTTIENANYLIREYRRRGFDHNNTKANGTP